MISAAFIFEPGTYDARFLALDAGEQIAVAGQTSRGTWNKWRHGRLYAEKAS